MKLRALFVLGGTLTLCGCSNSASPQAKTATPTSRPVAVRSTPAPAVTATPSPTGRPATPGKKPAKSKGKNPHGSAFDEGSRLLQARNYPAAQKQFELSVQRHQNVAESYAGIGAAAIRIGDFTTAFSAYKKAIQKQPKNPAFYYDAAYAALYARQWKSAVSYATQYVNKQPNNAAGYHLRFLAYGQALKRKLQVRDAQKIVKLAPRSPDSYNDLGIALTNDNKFAQGVQAFSHAIQMRPANAGYYINRALAENFTGASKQVLADLYKARSLSHDPTTIHNIDQAIAHYQAIQSKAKHK